MRQTGSDLLNHIWSPHVATTMIGISFAVAMAVQQNWTYSEILSDLAHGMTRGLFAKMLLGIALLVGATIGGATAGRFTIVKPNLPSLVRHLAGGALMGIGGLLIPGGNTGLALVGLPLLLPYAWLAFESICMTIYVALRLTNRGRLAVDASGSLSRFRPRSGGVN